MAFEKINGIRTHYLVDGSKDCPTITFIHGQAFDVGSWSRQIDAFKDQFQILRIDLRGHGLTEVGELGNDLRMLNMAEDIIGLWDYLEIKRSHYVGKSLGGMVGFDLALHNADRLNSLTLVATQGKMPCGSLDRMRRNAEDYRKSPLKMKLAAGQLLSRYLPESYQKNDPTGYRLLEESIMQMSIDAYAFSSEAINAMDYDDHLKDINLPTLVIAGELDIPTPPSRMEIYREKIRGAEWGVISGAAHLPNFEKPKEFNALLKQFLK